MISSVTDAVADDVKNWQARPLDAVPPSSTAITSTPKVREGAVQVNAVYLAQGINLARPVDRPERGRQVLVAGGDRIAQ